MGERSSGLVVF